MPNSVTESIQENEHWQVWTSGGTFSGRVSGINHSRNALWLEPLTADDGPGHFIISLAHVEAARKLNIVS